MSKRTAALGWVAALLATAQVATAADIAPVEEPYVDFNAWYFAVSGGLNTVFDIDAEGDDIFSDGEAQFHWGARGGAAIGYYWTENLRSEIEFAYSSTEADEFEADGPDDFGLDGSLNVFSVLAKIDYGMQFFGWWRPYLGVGVGAANVSVDDIGLGGGVRSRWRRDSLRRGGRGGQPVHPER